LALGGGLGGVDLGGPTRDEGGVGAGFKGGAVAAEALVAVGDDPLGGGDTGLAVGVVLIGLGVDHGLDRLG
jgi:hypothetical protein